MFDLAISVVIPTYNRSNLVLRAVNSALQQCTLGDEVIVIDDGSSDNTPIILEPLLGMIRYFRVPNAGVSAARNFGIKQAINPLIAFLDDDDEWLSNKILLQRQLMELRSDVLFSFTNFENQFSDGQRESHGIFNWGQIEQSWEKIIGPGVPYSTIAELPDGISDFNAYIGNIYLSQLADDYVLPSTLLVRKSAGDELYFPEDLSFCESWACSSRLAHAGAVAYLDFDASRQHGHAGPRLTDVPMEVQARSRIKVLERQWGSDADFLSNEKKRYEQRLDRERLLLIKELITKGQNRTARMELHKMKASAPLHYRFLASMPDFASLFTLNIMRSAFKISRYLKRHIFVA
jgi:glycosyltransferase involved in cell wall biosynthesis